MQTKSSDKNLSLLLPNTKILISYSIRCGCPGSALSKSRRLSARFLSSSIMPALSSASFLSASIHAPLSTGSWPRRQRSTQMGSFILIVDGFMLALDF